MGKVIPFAPPVRRENVQYSYAELQKHTAIEIRDLVNYYKNTGGLGPRNMRASRRSCDRRTLRGVREPRQKDWSRR